ncbi:MAG: transposase family protein [Colwellia sp.]|nr:transposase family protein [Colwellia sp.]
MAPHQISLQWIINVSCTIEWERATSHRHSIISPVTKTMMAVDRVLTGATFRDLAVWYGVSHTTCWRIFHDTSDLIVVTLG